MSIKRRLQAEKREQKGEEIVLGAKRKLGKGRQPLDHV
jgi:hypothetical protein